MYVMSKINTQQLKLENATLLEDDQKMIVSEPRTVVTGKLLAQPGTIFNHITHARNRIFSMKCFTFRKGWQNIVTTVGPPVRELIHSLKLVDFLHVQADKPWYNFYIVYFKHKITTWIQKLICLIASANINFSSKFRK